MAKDISSGPNRFVAGTSAMGSCGIQCATGAGFPRPCPAPPRFCACPGPVGPPGPAGPMGLQGVPGATAATIPFSLASGAYGDPVGFSTDENGNPQAIQFAGFGSNGSYMQTIFEPGEWEAGILNIRYYAPYPPSFIMPYTGTLMNVHALFANRNDLLIEEAIAIRPFVCLAVSDGVTLSFRLLRETMTFTQPYVGGTGEVFPKYSLRSGSLTNLNLELAQGSLLGILGGFVADGATSEIQLMLSYSGGLYIE